ncbi:hypothetical protein EVAR_99781_1 [Eumeta japonica]|uniref:Uncharacterized protein n=1 Tax=Eumeta variegata TaxID=151549 RepID=A0A4C1ZMA0_EUMVA|nr:hypothetical protein EVAR_99781_1 [Eumeta japonica]
MELGSDYRAKPDWNLKAKLDWDNNVGREKRAGEQSESTLPLSSMDTRKLTVVISALPASLEDIGEPMEKDQADRQEEWVTETLTNWKKRNSEICYFMSVLRESVNGERELHLTYLSNMHDPLGEFQRRRVTAARDAARLPSSGREKIINSY